jgi:ribosomal 30S subunit maturation factor RimM
MKKVLVIVITVLLIVGIVFGCVYWYKTATIPNEVALDEPLFSLENYPKVDASLAIHPLVDSIAADFLGIPESELNFEYTTTRSSEVYRNLIDGKVDVIFAAELVGVQVYEDGNLLGKITQVLDYPGNKVYVVKGEHQYMIPAVKAFILSTDMVSETMQVKTIEGMRTDES